MTVLIMIVFVNDCVIDACGADKCFVRLAAQPYNAAQAYLVERSQWERIVPLAAAASAVAVHLRVMKGDHLC